MKVAKDLRSKLAVLLAAVLVMTSLLPMGAMAAEPDTKAKIVSLKVLFSATYYAQKNPDVYAAYGTDVNLLYQHYINYGIPEGRQYLTPILDVHAYRVANPDLEERYGDHWEGYLRHFLLHGVYEVTLGQRVANGVIFNPAEYLRLNPEVMQTTNGNLIAAMEHYIAAGMPLGSWVNAQYTGGPSYVTQEEHKTDSSTSTSTSTSGVTSNSGSDAGSSDYGGSDGVNSGGNGSKPVVPDEPTVDDPSTKPEKPDEPEKPVEHVHDRDSFDESGACKTEGCDYTLAAFQRDCKMDHSAIEIGHFCLVCGAEGTYDPAKEHTKDSVHTKNSFGEDGLCVRGCGLTLEEFQAACTSEEHETLKATGGTCSVCGKQIEKEGKPSGCPNAANHAKLKCGEKCPDCDYVVEHTYSRDTGKCTICGAYCSTDECPKKAEHSKIPCMQSCELCGTTIYSSHDYSEVDGNWVCSRCGARCRHAFYNGTCQWCGAPDPDWCTNRAFHTSCSSTGLCPECGRPSGVDHVFLDGKCIDCDATCTVDTCPNKDGHAELGVGVACPRCGVVIHKASGFVETEEEINIESLVLETDSSMSDAEGSEDTDTEASGSSDLENADEEAVSNEGLEDADEGLSNGEDSENADQVSDNEGEDDAVNASGIPDALPVKITDGVSEQVPSDDTEPDDNKDTSGGGGNNE